MFSLWYREQFFLTENSDVNPQTFYSMNKVQIESDLKTLTDDNFSPIALRFATIYGLSYRIRFDVVINMLIGMAVTQNKIILNSNGLSWRPNLHILDACQSIKCAIELDHNNGKLLVMNVGQDADNLRIIDIANCIKRFVDKCDILFLSDRPELDKEGLIKDRKIKNGEDNRTYKVSFQKIKSVMPQFECKMEC